ncbi:MAG: hypothetical protein EBT81_09700, partial [Gammaproteobacteria bacterium]|nr:hypothetical protein [Gammaproteobacteria bacterium]
MKSRELNLPAALQPLRDAIARLPESDQRTLRLGSVAVAAILILGGWVTVNEKASAAEQRLADRRAQLADLPLRLAELRRGVRLG